MLTCNINISSTAIIVSYLWKKGNVSLQNRTTNYLNISSLQLSDNETQYTCCYTVSSVYYTNDVMGESMPHLLIIIGMQHV